MIAFSVSRIDIRQYELDKVRPADIIERQERELWAVREQPFHTDLSPRYLWAQSEGFVRVPLFPYLSAPEPDMAVGLGVQLGLLALHEWEEWAGRQYLPRLLAVRAHLSYGHPVQDLGTNLRFWLGVALLIKEVAPCPATNK